MDLPITFASFYCSLYSSILPCTWFHSLNITRKIIVTFSRLRFGHNRQPAQAFYLYLNDFQSCTCHGFEGNAGHLLFHYPVLKAIWKILSNIFLSNNIPLTIPLLSYPLIVSSLNLLSISSFPKAFYCNLLCICVFFFGFILYLNIIIFYILSK